VSTGIDKKKRAQDFLDVDQGRVAEGQPLPVKLDRILFDELRADLSAFYNATGKLRHPADAERRLTHLDTAFRGWPAVNITPAAITAYAAKRLTEKVPVRRDGQLVRELAMLKRLLRLAARNGKLLRVPAFDMLRESAPRAGFLDEPAFRAIVRNLPGNAALAATIGYETAWRIQSEVLPLTWARVDLTAGAIRLDAGTTKNDEGRTASLGPDTAQISPGTGSASGLSSTSSAESSPRSSRTWTRAPFGASASGSFARRGIVPVGWRGTRAYSFMI
jgi:integrase